MDIERFDVVRDLRTPAVDEVIADNVFGDGDRILRFGPEGMVTEVCFQVVLRQGLESDTGVGREGGTEFSPHGCSVLVVVSAWLGFC